MIIDLISNNHTGITIQNKSKGGPIPLTSDISLKLDGIDISSLITRAEIVLDAKVGMPEIRLHIIQPFIQNTIEGKVVLEYGDPQGNHITMECVRSSTP